MPIRKDLVIEIPYDIKRRIDEIAGTCIKEFRSQYFIERTNDIGFENKIAASLVTNGSTSKSVACKFASFDFHVNENDIQLIECSIFPAGLSFVGSEVMHPSMKSHYLKAINDLFCTYNTITILDDDLKNQTFLPEFFWLKGYLEKLGKRVFISEASDLTYDAHNKKALPRRELVASGGFRSIPSDVEVDFIVNRLPFGDALDAPKKFQALLDCQNDKSELFATTYYEWIISEKSSLPLLAENSALTGHLGSPTLVNSSLSLDQIKKTYGTKVVAKPLYSRGGRGVMVKPSNPQLKAVLDRNEEYLLQRYSPAPKLPTGEKYDVRAYVLNGNVVGYLARLFYGAVTNFKSQGSGHCQVAFT